MSEALKPYLARSAGAHAVLLAGVALLGGRAVVKSDKVYTIDFVGSSTIQSAGPASAPREAGPAEPAASRPAPQADQDSIGARSKHAALPRPSLLKGWTEKQDPPKPSLGGGDTAPSAEPSAGQAPAGAGAGVTTDLPNFPYPWYISQVRQMLFVQWQRRMPPGGGTGTAVFSILRNGNFTDLRMESSSGDLDFDRAALESVQAAAPFPALPSDFGEPFLKIHLELRAQ